MQTSAVSHSAKSQAQSQAGSAADAKGKDEFASLFGQALVEGGKSLPAEAAQAKGKQDQAGDDAPKVDAKDKEDGDALLTLVASAQQQLQQDDKVGLPKDGADVEAAGDSKVGTLLAGELKSAKGTDESMLAEATGDKKLTVPEEAAEADTETTPKTPALSQAKAEALSKQALFDQQAVAPDNVAAAELAEEGDTQAQEAPQPQLLAKGTDQAPADKAAPQPQVAAANPDKGAAPDAGQRQAAADLAQSQVTPQSELQKVATTTEEPAKALAGLVTQAAAPKGQGKSVAGDTKATATKVDANLVASAEPSDMASPELEPALAAAQPELKPAQQGQGAPSLADSNLVQTTAVHHKLDGSAPVTQQDQPKEAASKEALVPQQRFNEALADKVNVMLSKNLRHAEIQLDPPELGSLMIRVQVHHQDAQVQFQASHAQTREWLQDAMPRLKDMMAENGFNLADGQVRDQGNGGDGRQAQGDNQGLAQGWGDEGSEEALPYRYELTSDGLVDAYA